MSLRGRAREREDEGTVGRRIGEESGEERMRMLLLEAGGRGAMVAALRDEAKVTAHGWDDWWVWMCLSEQLSDAGGREKSGMDEERGEAGWDEKYA